MKKWIPYLKNKYIFSTLVFLVYILFLDDHDIFTIIGQKRKLNRLELAKEEMSIELEKTREVLTELENPNAVERFAREKKFFKKDDEDIFVIFHE